MKQFALGVLALLIHVASAQAADALIPQSATCASADGSVSIQVFVKGIWPTQASLVVNAAIFNSTATYLVQDLTGKYDATHQVTVFSYTVDGTEVDVTLPDSATKQATISSPSSTTQYQLNCKSN